MKLSFESNLEYQRDAIQSVVSLFEGQARRDSGFRYDLDEDGVLNMIDGIGNRLSLSDDQILENLRKIQESNGLALSDRLDRMHFSIEMETGTGKTYVYLRTIYELNRKYGFKKFVIVVPSVPIREGVLKNLQITHDHFQSLYDNVPVRYYVNNQDFNVIPGCKSS